MAARLQRMRGLFLEALLVRGCVKTMDKRDERVNRKKNSRSTHLYPQTPIPPP